MQHRLRNRIIIRCLSSGETGCALMPDDTDVKPGDALKLGVTPMCHRCVSECGLTPMCAHLMQQMQLIQLMQPMPPSPHKPHKPK